MNAELKDIPAEVAWVYIVSSSEIMVGVDTYRQCVDIMDRNPSYFPDYHKEKKEREAKYKEPHKKYYRLKYGL